MSNTDLEASSTTYTPLPSDGETPVSNHLPRNSVRLLTLAFSVFLLIALAAIISDNGSDSGLIIENKSNPIWTSERGVKEGVSSKSSSTSKFLKAGDGFPWTNAMLAWQRTGFHFQPERNWMNDPNGPLFYKGWYHLFYQYNPDSAVWGNITWGHAVSHDLLHWTDLPLAMVPDKWYDVNGVWTGSATFLPDGRIVMLYTGATNEMVQVQNLATPANLDDPLLLDWVKAEDNPVLLPPPGIGLQDFRDPTTAWYDSSDSTWRTVIGSKDASHSGIAIVYSTKDFISYELLPGILHAVPQVGMWECVDFYPVAIAGNDTSNGLDPSVPPSNNVKHVLKASMDDDRNDYYAIGTYDPKKNTWVPDDEKKDVGIGLRYDWGKFYASKTFYDQKKSRRILWGWIPESDSESADIAKGWASLQGLPRTVLFDVKSGTHLLTWPVEEVDSLRGKSKDFSGITIDTGSTFQLDVNEATQLDIVAEFQINRETLDETIETDVTYSCSTSGGAASRGLLGPFGLLVLANKELTEQTAAYFYLSKGRDGELKTHFCQDESRSSKATDIIKRVVGSTVPVLDGEKFYLRVLVDHSIVESFAQGGRASATSRVYPTEAIYQAARVFLFNNATGATVTAKTLKIWEMSSTFSHSHPLPGLKAP